MGDIFTSVSDFEKRLGLPTGFYHHLLNEGDWSFIIQLSALFEAACTHALTLKLDAPQLEGCFSHLDQANSKFGKIKLLKELGVIYPDQATFLTKLASLRNDMAHDISNVSMSLKAFTTSMDSQQKDSFVKWAGHGILPEVTHKERKIDRKSFVIDNPKLSIWLTAAEILGCIYLEVEHSELAQSLGVYKWLKDITSTRS
tara:strand:- start:14904 stop:15503 length:600 start_codon:yes stop_codon:yes gene_type:complete